jgi:hypothetical protein
LNGLGLELSAGGESRRRRCVGGAGGLLGGERGFAAGVDAALLGRGDAFALAFADQGTFEFGEGP